MTEQPPPPAAGPEGWVATLLHSVKGLTLVNVLVIALLVIIALPTYAIYSALNDPVLLDRFLSGYSMRVDETTGCTIRKARVRGGSWFWAVSSGFAMQRSDRWQISVILSAEPDADDVQSYCATLGLIVDKLLFDDSTPDVP